MASVEVTPKEIAFLQAFESSGYTYRSAGKLATQMNLPRDEVQRLLTATIAKGLVNQLLKEDKVKYYLTAEGRTTLEDHR